MKYSKFSFSDLDIFLPTKAMVPVFLSDREYIRDTYTSCSTLNSWKNYVLFTIHNIIMITKIMMNQYYHIFISSKAVHRFLLGLDRQYI